MWVVLVSIVGVGGVVVVQRIVDARLRRDALARAAGALTAYVDALSEGGSLGRGLAARQLRGLVDGDLESAILDADEACREMSDALYDLEDYDIAPHGCETLVSYNGCAELGRRGIDSVLGRVAAVERCVVELAEQDAELPLPAVADQAPPQPPLSATLPSIPDGYRLRGSPTWWPTQQGVVVTMSVRKESRCGDFDEREGLDCVRPALFTITWDGEASPVRTYAMPDDCRGWHRSAVAEDGTFVTHARGPGIQRIFRVTFDGNEADTWLRWDPEQDTGPQELAKLPWLAESWRALERERPQSVGVRKRFGRLDEDATRLALPDGHATLHLEDGQLVLARHDGDGADPSLVRLASAGDHRIHEAHMGADPNGRIVVHWRQGKSIQWLVAPPAAE